MKRFLFLLAAILFTPALIACGGASISIDTAATAVAPTTNAPSAAAPTLQPPGKPSTKPPVVIPTNQSTAIPTNAAPTQAAPTSEPMTPAANDTPISDPTLAKHVADAKADLATRANVPVEEIQVISAKQVEWNDGSLGCPKPGIMYTQSTVPGYQVILEVNGKQYDYHAGRGDVFLCEK